MNEVWWAIVRFFKKLFSPPEYTSFERFLVDQVYELEKQLANERARNNELIERFVFGSTRPVPNEEASLTTVVPPLSSVASTRKKLEDASKRRWEEAVAKLEEEAKLKSQKDEEESRKANQQSEGLAGLQNVS